MMWRQKQPEPNYKPGDYRKRKAFLWMPRTINGETRWLETSRWRQQAYTGLLADEFGVITVLKWRDVEWLPGKGADPKAPQPRITLTELMAAKEETSNTA